jgi:hypothetical protein
MFTDQPNLSWSAAYNKILKVGFSCGIPSGINPLWSIPSAAVGLNARGQETPEYGFLSFDSCSSYDIYTDGVTSVSNFQHATIHDVHFLNPHYKDGVGLYYTSTTGSGTDSDYGRFRNLWGIYQSAPMLYLATLDNVRVEGVHAFHRGTQNVYGVDVAGPVYGGGENNQANTGYLSGLSTTSVMRGLESTATPPSNVMILGFDPTNSVPVIAARPGTGNLTFLDYNGKMQFPPNSSGSIGSISMGRASPFSNTPIYAYGDNKQIINQMSTTVGAGIIGIRTSDYLTNFSDMYMLHYGSTVSGNIFGSIPKASLGALVFQNINGLIYTNNNSPIIFGSSAIDRGRLEGNGHWLFGTATDCGTTLCFGGDISLGTKKLISTTAPTIASGGCTTGSTQNIPHPNGTAAFDILLGGATCGSTIVLTMPVASFAWACDAHNITNPATNVVEQSAGGSTTSVTFTNYNRTTGVAANFTGADILAVKCSAY